MTPVRATLLTLAVSCTHAKIMHNPTGGAFLNVNVSTLQDSGPYGKEKCPCVGIDNLEGNYDTTADGHQINYPAETGASCGAWEEKVHPLCKDNPKDWCAKKWCYVDPCNCQLVVLPKPSSAGVKYQGSPAYWSYNTCGAVDTYSEQTAKKDACVLQKNHEDCTKNFKCAWDPYANDGKGQCGGKEVVESCAALPQKDESVHGTEDCRCVGLHGRTGKAKMWLNAKKEGTYPADLGGTCQAWENDVHPDCLKGGDKPKWCAQKWCFVDPCKCRTKVPPKSVSKHNDHMRFQNKRAYWSYEACGSQDAWTADHAEEYCINKKSMKECFKLDKCIWTGKECLGKEIVEACESSALGLGLGPLAALIAALGAFARA